PQERGRRREDRRPALRCADEPRGTLTSNRAAAKIAHKNDIGRDIMRLAVWAIGLGIASLAAQSAMAAETIKIGMQKPVGGPLYIANDKGYYAAEGLTPDYVFFEAGEPIAVAVASGAVDFGVAGLTGGFYSLAGQGALKII